MGRIFAGAATPLQLPACRTDSLSGNEVPRGAVGKLAVIGPREIKIVASLPRTETGKLQRFRLRQPQP